MKTDLKAYLKHVRKRMKRFRKDEYLRIFYKSQADELEQLIRCEITAEDLPDLLEAHERAKNGYWASDKQMYRIFDAKEVLIRDLILREGRAK